MSKVPYIPYIFHVNKRCQHKYGKLPTKLIISRPYETPCMDLIWWCTLNVKDNTVNYIVCFRIIDQATSWLKIVELPVTEVASIIPMGKMGHKGTTACYQSKEAYSDNSSAQVSSLVNKISLVVTHDIKRLSMIMEASSSSILKPYVNHTVSSVSQQASRTSKQMQYWSRCIK